ncbi:YciI family protein [Roseomonas elaeocarpi]|uniref:YciI family protein n=1 Tax=Roseomonas elaeocarpi TaxID=907779 RepID=A0ABV6JX37_9PROT
MAFLVIAHDGTDEGALARRMAARPTHFERVTPEAERGVLLMGGALTDAEGRMTGSMLVLDLPDEAAVRRWLAEDPYSQGDVWREVQVTPFRPAALPYQPPRAG